MEQWVRTMRRQVISRFLQTPGVSVDLNGSPWDGFKSQTWKPPILILTLTNGNGRREEREHLCERKRELMANHRSQECKKWDHDCTHCDLAWIKCPTKAMAPHSSALAWKVPRTEEPGGLQSMGSRRVGHNWVTSLSLFSFMDWRRKWQPTPVFLPGESQGWGNLVGCPSMGSHRVGHDWSDLAAAAAAVTIHRMRDTFPKRRGGCYRFSCIPSKNTHWNSNSLSLRMWLYLETESLQM